MNKENKTKLLAILLSTIIATTKAPSSHSSNKFTNKDLYYVLNFSDELNKNEVEDLYLTLSSDLNLETKKELKNKLNYISYLINKNNLHNNYVDYLKTLTGEYLTIKDLDDMIPQGLTQYKDYILFSTYFENSNTNSCIYVLDKNSNIVNKTSLDNNSHVGGITYDKTNNLLWVTVVNKLYAYDINDIIYKDKVKSKYQTEELLTGLDKCSFVTYDNNKLYVGTYKNYLSSKINIYNIEYLPQNNNINLKLIDSIKIPSKIQGLAFLNIDNKKYLLLSKSHSPFANSQILIYNYAEQTKEYIDNYLYSITCPSMIEEIFVTKDDKILSLYESNAKKYEDCKSNINHIYYSSLQKK